MYFAILSHLVRHIEYIFYYNFNLVKYFSKIDRFAYNNLKSQLVAFEFWCVIFSFLGYLAFDSRAVIEFTFLDLFFISNGNILRCWVIYLCCIFYVTKLSLFYMLIKIMYNHIGKDILAISRYKKCYMCIYIDRLDLSGN